MAMSLSRPHPDRPYEDCGVKLGDEQFAQAEEWERGRPARAGRDRRRARACPTSSPGTPPTNSSTRSTRSACATARTWPSTATTSRPSFSIWTTIEECLNPPVVYETDRGWFTTAPFSEPEVFDFPEGIGPVECVNVEHEEVLLIPRWVDAGRVTFKYGLGDEFIDVLKTLHKLGLDRTDPVTVGGAKVSPRDVVAACLPDPAGLGDRMHGKTCAGHLGQGHQGRRAARGVPLPRGRQRVVDGASTAPRPSSGRPRSTPWSPSN